MREREYAEAVTLLHTHKRYETVMRVTVYNELPSFLDPIRLHQAWESPSLEVGLSRDRQHFREGLKLLLTHWKYGK